MKIGYDAKRAAANFTGLGNYSRYIIDGVVNHDTTSDITLYAPRISNNIEYKALFNHHNISEFIPSGFFARKFSSLWRSFSIVKDIRKENITIYHGLSNELPFGIKKSNAKSLVTIHDLIFLRLPHCYRFFDRIIYNIKFKYACQNADQIIAVSECTKRDIIHFYGIRPDKISVIYQGCSKIFKGKATEEQKKEIREKYNLPERYILNVGTLEERKNLFLIVKALKGLPEDIHLVAVGRKTSYSDMVMEYAKENGISNRIHLLHSVQFSHLPIVYQNSEIFAYPSYYEGFGIPIIEAINCGLPVIAATGSCLEEAGGKGAIYINPNNVVEFQDTVNQLISNNIHRDELIAAGKEHIKKFDDDQLALQMIKLYNHL